jgi:hypothetical protein
MTSASESRARVWIERKDCGTVNLCRDDTKDIPALKRFGK